MTTLEIVTTSLIPRQVGISAYEILQGSGGDGVYTWSVSGLPSGLMFNPVYARIEGTPKGSPGSFDIIITLSDGQGTTVTKTLVMAISAQPLTITTASLPNGTQNSAYTSTTMSATGGSSYSWTATGLPSGLTMSSAGVLSGTPTVSGSFTVSVTVTSGGQTTNKSFTLTIAAALTITTTSLNTGTCGTSYNQILTAAGGTTYTWTDTNSLGFLWPTGLSLSSSGIISGTPTVTATDKNVQVNVASGGNTNSKIFKITINGPCPTSKKFNVTQSSTFTACPTCIIYTGTYFIIGAFSSVDNCLLYSTNGTTWTRQSITPSNLPLAKLFYAPSDSRIYGIGPNRAFYPLCGGNQNYILSWRSNDLVQQTSINTNQLRQLTADGLITGLGSTGRGTLVGSTSGNGASTVLCKNTSTWVANTVNTVTGGLDWYVEGGNTYLAGNNTIKNYILRTTSASSLGGTSTVTSVNAYPGLLQASHRTTATSPFAGVVGANSSSNIYSSLDGINWSAGPTSYKINVTKPIYKGSADQLIAAGAGIVTYSVNVTTGVITSVTEDPAIPNANIVDFAYAPDKNMIVFVSGDINDSTKLRCAFSATY